MHIYLSIFVQMLEMRKYQLYRTIKVNYLYIYVIVSS